MTLILTRVARDGVVMSADSAITEEFGNQVRILHGARKLFPHDASSSCVATWGGGTVPHPDGKSAPIAIEFVLDTFLENAKSITSGFALVDALGKWLGETYCANRDFIGFDIASVRPQAGIALPAVYRLTNAATPDKPPSRFFDSRILRNPIAYDAQSDQVIIPAGDRNAGVWVDEFHAASRHAVGRTGREPLPDNIGGLSGWLPSVVRAVSDAYQCLEIGHSIGGQISCVTLRSSDGRIESRTV